MTKTPGEIVYDFGRHSSDQGPYRHLWVETIAQWSRKDGRVVNGTVVTAAGIKADGRRELPGLDVFLTKLDETWPHFRFAKR